MRSSEGCAPVGHLSHSPQYAEKHDEGGEGDEAEGDDKAGHAATSRVIQNEVGIPYAFSNSIALDSDGRRLPFAKSLA